MQNQNTEKHVEEAMLLDQILLRPSGKLVTDRFLAHAEEATCGAACSGQCHGFV